MPTWTGNTVVSAGETAAGVALRCDLALAMLRRQNGMGRGAEVYAGMSLKVPAAVPPEATE